MMSAKDSADFVIFDKDANLLFDMSCADMIQGMENAGGVGGMPPQLEGLVDKTWLFKIEAKANHNPRFEQSYRVRKICTDAAIIQLLNEKWDKEEAAVRKSQNVCLSGESEDDDESDDVTESDDHGGDDDGALSSDNDQEQYHEFTVKVTEAFAYTNQVFYFPNITSKYVLDREQNKIVLRDEDTGRLCSCSIKTAKRYKFERYLADGWNDFKNELNLRPGDLLFCAIQEPPTHMNVRIIRDA
ncbi:hypothetical protein TSUD_395990 [Trifolium subterraneum]|uniref:TF-B3 domain-containing protein n=1 Tax=Trifolium subterraneum TaxID=3900 RepID=A0A2Z6NR38_TRISU|nr:hypothetical protein TSUD_395990 [Trifolium subterraneum]